MNGVLFLTHGSGGTNLVFRYPLKQGSQVAAAASPHRSAAPPHDSSGSSSLGAAQRHRNQDAAGGAASSAPSPSQASMAGAVPAAALLTSTSGHASPVSSLADEEQELVYGLRPSVLAKVLCAPRATGADAVHQVSLDSHTFVASEVDLPGDRVSRIKVVVALSGDSHAHGRARERVSAHAALAQRLAAAYGHEERRCGYVSEQAALIAQIQEQIEAQQAVADDDAAAPERWSDVALQRCRLAAELRIVYTGIRSTGRVSVLINSWIDVSVLLDTTECASLAPIRPYQALMLLASTTVSGVDAATDDTAPADVQDVASAETMPSDCSPALLAVVSAATPFKTLDMLHRETEIPLNQICQVAAHLVRWGRARLLLPVDMHHVYALVRTHVSPAVRREFQSQYFSGPPLTQIMQWFSGPPRPLGEHVDKLPPHQQSEASSIVIWLMKHDFLKQLHRYVYLMPGTLRTTSSSTTSVFGQHQHQHQHQHQRQQQQQSPQQDSPPLPQQTKQPQPRVITAVYDAYLDGLNDGSHEYKLLRRLAPYFTGDVTTDEILWSENVPPDAFDLMLRKYNDILISVLR